MLTHPFNRRGIRQTGSNCAPPICLGQILNVQALIKKKKKKIGQRCTRETHTTAAECAACLERACDVTVGASTPINKLPRLLGQLLPFNPGSETLRTPATRAGVI